MPVLIARRLLKGGYTRKLGIIIQKGQVGVRGQKATSEIVEFGLGGQKCNNMSNVLKFIVNSEQNVDDNPMRALFASTINLTESRRENLQWFVEQNNRLSEFCKDQEKKVALLVWGQHARVLFKCDTFPWFRIVDPWKPKNKVKVPHTLYENFWDADTQKQDIQNKNDYVWVEREPEQSDESSCFMVAIMRAMAIACAASSENNSDADLLQVAQQPPSQGMAPLCVAIATLTRNLTMQINQIKTHEYRQVELFDEPPLPPPLPESDPEDDVPLSQLMPKVKESPDSDDETLDVKRMRMEQQSSG